MNKKPRNRNRRPSVATPVYPVITLEQAKELGYTASFCRTLARSFERIGRKGYSGGQEYIDYPGDNVIVVRETIPAYNVRSALNASFNLRKIAKELA